MKLIRYCFIPALFIGLISFSSCDKGGAPEPSVEETQHKLLSGTWTISQVRFGAGNTDRTSEYTGMKLTLSGDFSSNNEYAYSRTTLAQISPLSKSGKWGFDTNDPENIVILLTDENNASLNIPVTYSVTETQLQLVFTYSGAGYAGRVSAVEGTWTFGFTK